MKKLNEALKQMLDALAYAHAGEYLTPREKAKILSEGYGPVEMITQVHEPTKVSTSRSNARHVALYLGSELPPAVMEYVIQTCMRLRHELTVLTFESEDTAHALLQPYEKAIDEAKVNMHVVTLSGKPVPGLARYLRSHPEVAFLACKDSGYLGRSYLNGTQRKNALPVPVVVVASGTQPVGKQVQPAPDQADRGVGVA